VFLPGCGGGAEDGASTADLAAAPTGSGGEEAEPAVEVANEFATEDYSFSFELIGKDEERGEPGAISITDTFSQYDRLGRLQEEHGLLTSLETFLAFAPDGQSPHPALLAAHEAEALAFGRIDTTTVQQLDGRNMVIDKDTGSSSDCGEELYPLVTPLHYTSQEFTNATISQTEIFLCSGSPARFGVGTPVGCPSFASTKYQVAVACSVRPGTASVPIFFFENRIKALNPTLIAPKQFVRKQLQPTATPLRIGTSLAVQTKNPANDNLVRLLTGVAEL